MKEVNQPVKDKEEQINENIYRAVSIYKFFISLPEVIARCVFNSIVSDAYEIAEILDLETAYGSLARSLFESFCPDYLGETNTLDRFIDCPDYSFKDEYNEYFEAIFSNCREKAETQVSTLAENLAKRHALELPDKSDLVRSYPLFSINMESISESDGLMSMVEKRIREGLKDIETLDKEYPMDTHCFYPLGYLTLLHRWSTSQSCDKQLMALIYRWYCKGEVLDYVLETYKRVQSRALVERMWDIFTDTCRRDVIFRDIFQERYNRIIGPHAVYQFTCEQELAPRMPALDPIPLENHGRSNASELHYQKLWEAIGPTSSKPFIKCPQAEFISLFSGRSATVSKPIVWFGKGKDLADFLMCCQGITQQSNRNYITERALQLFQKESGKPFAVITMKKSSRYEDNFIMKRIFNSCGFIR